MVKPTNRKDLAMHNESQADRSEEDVVKGGKLKKLRGNAVVAGMYIIPVGIVAASSYLGIKTQMTQLEIAKLNLEVARKAAGK